VERECYRQLQLWGDQAHPDGTGMPGDPEKAQQAKNHTEEMTRQKTLTWRAILEEEVREAFAESATTPLRTELIQSAAVIVSWVHRIDRRAAETQSEADTAKAQL
jgi:hypothetical protein